MINLLPGRIYGWPVVSFNRFYYSGERVNEHPTREGFEPPLLVSLPSAKGLCAPVRGQNA